MAVLSTVLGGIGACAALIERRLAEFGGHIPRYQRVSSRLQLPNGGRRQAGRHHG
jgi:hypothetical protein